MQVGVAGMDLNTGFQRLEGCGEGRVVRWRRDCEAAGDVGAGPHGAADDDGCICDRCAGWINYDPVKER